MGATIAFETGDPVAAEKHLSWMSDRMGAAAYVESCRKKLAELG